MNEVRAVRRILALFLVLAFGLPLIAPALTADAASQLPACCRRDGAHHCSMMSGEVGPGPAFQAGGHKCPLFPASFSLSASNRHEIAIPVQGWLDTASPRRDGLVQRREQSPVRVSFDRSNHKRGPPLLIS